MAAARIVLVSPMHDSNVGSVARAMKNFGFSQLALVNPRCKLGMDATMWGKHAEDILEGAKRCKSLAEAVEGCSIVVGTTGAVSRYGGAIKTCLTPGELAEKTDPKEGMAIVFGPEDSGLTERELQACDMLVSIPMHYGVMNLSHSVAVLLYALRDAWGDSKRLHYEPAPKEKVREAEYVFNELVKKVPRIRDRAKVSRAFSHVLDRARATEEEVQSMLAALGEVRRKFSEEPKAVKKPKAAKKSMADKSSG